MDVVNSLHEKKLLNARIYYDAPLGAPVTAPDHLEAARAEAAHEARYEELRRILDDAYHFASRGKGELRHGHGGLNWTEQRHATIGRELGTSFAIGQAVKKAFESEGLDTPDARVRELLGAMTYLASAVYLIKKEGK